ncbi:MAG: S1 RNA-binding domain-containing protein [Candidatus Micrarchaeota archaeon]
MEPNENRTAAEDYPEIGEVVVVNVKRVLDYGAFADLLEYPNVAGFVHISEIASRWVKNIRNHVKENQVRAAKVLAIKRDKNQVDLSLTKVSEGQQRQRIDEWKKQKRCQKLIEILAKKSNLEFVAVWNEIVEPLYEEYDSVFEAFSKIALEGKSAAKKVPEKWIGPLVELCQSNIEVSKKTLEADLELSSNASDGVENIKFALAEAKTAGQKWVPEIFYKGSGHFAVRVTASTFKDAEKGLETITQKAISAIGSKGGKGLSQKVEKAKKGK